MYRYKYHLEKEGNNAATQSTRGYTEKYARCPKLLNSFWSWLNLTKNSSFEFMSRTTRTVKRRLNKTNDEHLVDIKLNLKCMIGLLRLQVKEAATWNPNLQNRPWTIPDGRYEATPCLLLSSLSHFKDLTILTSFCLFSLIIFINNGTFHHS